MSGSRNTRLVADESAPPVTRILGRFVATHPSTGWTAAVDHEAHRTFLNWAGCAIGAARHPTVEAALAAVRMLEPAAQAGVLGRSDRVDTASAALLNGITSHTFDFDDTHLATIIHPAGPVASAVLALAEHRGASGRAVVDALVIGVDVECRIGNAIYPDHYDRGWHITGSTGMFGAAAGCARVLGLDEQRAIMALAIAASQPVGVREQFGTMTKPLHPGAAARAGLMSALLASRGFTGSERAIEAPRGFAQVVSTKFDWAEITDALGERFEIAANTYKPFACGIVIHPSIDGCIQLRNEHGLTADGIERIELAVHPLVKELTGKRSPRTGLECKFSVYHACAAAIVHGRAGENEFSDAMAVHPNVVALRDRVTATADPSFREESANVVVVCRDGRRLERRVEHAIGSRERPIDDQGLEAKFHGLADGVIGREAAAEVLEQCWTLGARTDCRPLVSSAQAIVRDTR